MEPQTFSDGVIRQPNAAMMAAGKEIMRINQLWEQDRAGRSRAEQMATQLATEMIEKTSKWKAEIAAATEKLNATMSPTITLADAIMEYKNVMNKDYDYAV